MPFRYHFHDSPILEPVSGQNNPAHTIAVHYVCKTYFNIIQYESRQVPTQNFSLETGPETV